ncbi:MAG: MFS transporter [Planctomycetota bacterium]
MLERPLYDRNFWLAFASQTSFVCANTLLAHYARWIEYLGGDLGQVGWIMGSCAIAGLALRPWMAQWINRIGARAMWGIGYLTFAIASLLNLVIIDIDWAIYAIRGSLVLGTAIVFASSLTYISLTTPEHRRTEAIGIFGIGGFTGMLCGPLLGDWFLAERSSESFQTLFVAATALSLLPALGLPLLRPTPGNGKKSSVKLIDFIATTRRYWPGMILLVDLAFGICMSAPFVFLASFIDAAALQIEGMSVIGLFFFFYAGVALVIRVLSRRWPDRYGVRKVLMLGVFFLTIGMFTFGLVDASNPWLIILPATTAGIGHSLMFHTMTSLTIEKFPVEVRGTGSALALMMLDLGTVGGTPVLGWIGENYGYPALFATIGLICLTSGVTYSGSEMVRSTRIELQSEPTG